MSGEQAVPSPERVAEIRKFAASGYGRMHDRLDDLLAALAAAESERDTAWEERDATSQTRAELQRSYENENARLRQERDAAVQRAAELSDKIEAGDLRMMELDAEKAAAEARIARVRALLSFESISHEELRAALSGTAGEAETPHEFTEDINDASMCVCGIPALTHDAAAPSAVREDGNES